VFLLRELVGSKNKGKAADRRFAVTKILHENNPAQNRVNRHAPNGCGPWRTAMLRCSAIRFGIDLAKENRASRGGFQRRWNCVLPNGCPG
jgi:hypothetical protein